MTLTVKRMTDIPLNDPDLFMRADIILGKVAGISTVLLQGDTVVFETDSLHAALDNEMRSLSSRFMMAKMAGQPQNGPAQSDVNALRFTQQALAPDMIELLRKKTQRSSVVPPVNLPDYDNTQSTPVGLSIMPGRNISGERYVTIHPAFSSAGFPDNAIPGRQLHFFFSTHELAHVAGAEEPQADMVAALLNRRAFGSDAATNFISDFRALDAITDAMDLLQMPDDPAAPSIVMERYMKYGWDMVAAADEALAVPAGQLGALTDADILAQARAPRDTMATNKAFFHMAAMMRESGYHVSPDITAFATTATRFAETVRTITPDTATHPMADRLALAMRRLAAGGPVYS